MPRMRTSSILALMAGAALILGGGGCAARAPAGTQPGPTVPAASATPTGGAPATASPVPASTAAELPATTGESGPTVLPTIASVTAFYIAEGDGGISGPAFGCGDSAVAVTSPAISFTDPVEAAFRTLLENKDMEVGESGLRNALWQSDLSVKSVDRSGPTLMVNLEGTLRMAGECDIPRAQIQLLLTAQQAAGVPIEIMVNGELLADALGLK